MSHYLTTASKTNASNKETMTLLKFPNAYRHSQYTLRYACKI